MVPTFFVVMNMHFNNETFKRCTETDNAIFQYLAEKWQYYQVLQTEVKF